MHVVANRNILDRIGFLLRHLTAGTNKITKLTFVSFGGTLKIEAMLLLLLMMLFVGFIMTWMDPMDLHVKLCLSLCLSVLELLLASAVLA